MTDYREQSNYNISCLFTDAEFSERRNCLLKIHELFCKNNITWGLACSANLFVSGIVDDFHDIDLIIIHDDVEKVHHIMEELGGQIIATGGNGFCESDSFYHYQVDRVDVDIISGFKVKTFGTEFQYNLVESEIDFLEIDKGVYMPLVSKEALFVLYYMMEGWQPRRRFKRRLLQEYLISTPLCYPSTLRDALDTSIPSWIKRDIEIILRQ